MLIQVKRRDNTIESYDDAVTYDVSNGCLLITTLSMEVGIPLDIIYDWQAVTNTVRVVG